jgi:polyisoprenoid-binding protein YceI
MPVRWITAAAFCAWVAIVQGATAQAGPGRPLAHGTLAFDADAPLGKFTGTTPTMKGELIGAPTLAGVRGWVEAPSNSLTTSNGHRDNDMAGSMEFDKFPVIRFDLDSVSPGAKSADSTAVTLNGSFTIHGQKRAAKVPGWIWLADKSGRFRGALPINVKDYGVGGLTKGPFGILKMSPMITVRIDVVFEQK